MPLQSPHPENSQAIIMVVILVAILCVIYWRTALRVVAVIVIATTVLGVIASLHGMHFAR